MNFVLVVLFTLVVAVLVALLLRAFTPSPTIVVVDETPSVAWPWPITTYNEWPWWYYGGGVTGGYSYPVRRGGGGVHPRLPRGGHRVGGGSGGGRGGGGGRVHGSPMGHHAPH